ncbi:photosystem reaction center subunit H [Bradyrhizobium brasilense]|uniref:photosystem reaction center subunit H n=1 Tax=Bradyrhizobium TaxID=374 RepID=UPI000976C618|nr:MULTISPECIES: photosystem reaction center subunit H [Bradyrhizobium]NLS71612.1 PRC-barrel domain containing protein [Bradyrhizobium brasilense]OMI11902.1 photosystem reaction center subunit H [Bradyrhizobium brasilense]
MNEFFDCSKRALNILSELHASEKELVGKGVVLSDGKAGTIEHVFVDDVHGLRIAIAGHEGRWPIAMVKQLEGDLSRKPIAKTKLRRAIHEG